MRPSILSVFVVLAWASCSTFVLADEPANKLAVPSESDLKESQAVLKDIFKDELQQAATPAKKLELAKKFIEQAVETKDDPTGRFALLQAAKNLAVGSGDLNLAMKAADELGRFYQVDLLATKVGVIKDVAPNISSSDANRALCEAAFQLLPQFLAADNYDSAQIIVGVAAEAARKAKDLSLAKQTRSRVEEVEAAAVQYANVKASAAILEQKPSDPGANLVVGKFQCFVKGDWKKGLPMLAMGDDAQLKMLAEQDAADPGSVASKVKVGDGWWALSETLEGITKTNIQRRAGFWYEKALPELSGLTKTKIEKRLASLPQTPDSGAPSVSSAADSSDSPKPNKAGPSDGRFDIRWERGWEYILEVKGPNVIFYGEYNPQGEKMRHGPYTIKYKFDAKKSTVTVDKENPGGLHFMWNLATGKANQIDPATRAVKQSGKVCPARE